jgi:hypothetical protein
MTTDRASGATLAVVGAVVLEECWRLRLPLGTLANPGPAYMPALLAGTLLVSGVLVAALGRQATALKALGWGEWRHTVAIVGACAFVALTLERLGYRLAMAVACAFLLGVVERKGVVVTVLFAVAMAAGTFYVFDTFLRVPLPRGAFGF